MALSKRRGINPKTVAKWKRRTSVSDLPTGPKDAKSTTLSIEEEGGGDHRRLPQAYTAAAGRLSLCLAGHDPEPDTVIAAPLPAAPWDQPVARGYRVTASAFPVALIAAVPYKIHTVPTDNGIQFTFPPRYADGPTATWITHMFDMRCEENGIEHRLTKIKHPWTNGQVERMNARSRRPPSNATIMTAMPS
jgi:transposase InsO family protein